MYIALGLYSEGQKSCPPLGMMKTKASATHCVLTPLLTTLQLLGRGGEGDILSVHINK